MRCLSADEVEAIFRQPRFRVAPWDGYRRALQLDPRIADRQARVGAMQPSDMGLAAEFVRAINRWLPTNQARLLWADQWDSGIYGFETALAEAAWRGLGESRSLDDAPGFFLEAQNWSEEDQADVPPTQAEALGMLVGLGSLIMITTSDGWLIATDCEDRIEFWEGHVLFHSKDKGQIRRAEQIMELYAGPRWKS